MIGQEEIKQSDEHLVEFDTLQVTCPPEAVDQTLSTLLDWSQQLHTMYKAHRLLIQAYLLPIW